MRRQTLILLIGLFYYLSALDLPAFGQTLTQIAEPIEALNSPFDEYRPCIVPNGKAIYFSRKGHPLNIGKDDHYDVWVAYRQSNGRWGKAVNLGTSINDKSDNIVVGTNNNGDLLFLSDPNYGLTYTQKKGRSWSLPKPIEIQNFSFDDVKANFHVSGNGLILLIAMPGKDSYGGRDLYISTKIKDGVWSTPQNLGGDINSSKEEYCAALANDGRTLYFLSNGHDNPMQGSLLISRSLNDDFSEWETPQSTGINLNPQEIGQFFSFPTEGDDIYCSMPGKEGDLEIVKIPLPSKYQPQPTLLLTGRLLDAASGNPIKGNVKLKALNISGSVQQQMSKRDGSFELVLPRDRDVGFYAEKPGYFSKSETINFSGQELIELDKEALTADADGGIMLLSPEAEQVQLRLQKVSSEFQQLSEQRRKEALLQAKQVRLTKGFDRQSDPELESLKHKYRAITNIESESEEEFVEPDSELDALKEKFRKYNDVSTPKSGNRKSKESELEAMKRKFNSENNNVTQEEDELMDMTVSPSETQKSFDELVDEVWYDLEGQLTKEVSYELKTDLIPEVANEIKNEMDDFTRKGYVSKFQRMTAVMESETKKELRKKYREEVKRELKGELIEVVEEELREALREEVKRELRQALIEEVRQELRVELEYQIKKEIVADLQKELNVKIRKSKKEGRVPQTPQFALNKEMQTKGTKVYKQREEINLELYKLVPNQIIPLNSIFFKANEATIKKDLSTDLDRLVYFLKNNPNVTIEIGAHTNGWCSVEFAENLSASRAKAIAEYLIDNGAVEEQIKYHGYGRSRPLVPNNSLENCKKNQRIDLKIVSI